MRHRSLEIPVVAVVLLLGLVACGGGEAGSSVTESPADPTTATPAVVTSLTPTPTTAPGRPDPSVPDVPLPTIPEGIDPAGVGYVTASIDLLAEMTGAAPADIEVIGFDEVVWRDGSIGCPQPGMNYTQALVDGTRVALGYDGEVYLFHTRAGRDPFWCEHPAEPLS